MSRSQAADRFRAFGLHLIPLLFIFYYLFIISSCDYGQLGGADQTSSFYPGDPVFEERLNFICGVWYSRYAGIGRLDGYRIRKWSELTAADKIKMQALFPAFNISSPKTYSTQDTPGNDDYILFYDDTVYGQQDDESEGQETWGFGYIGVVRAINIFNDNKDRGAIIIEYFEKADPEWLYDPDGYAWQGLAPGEKPFFGIYYRVLEPNVVQMANAVDLAALYAGKLYHVEKKTLMEAVDFNSVENEAELISWGVVIPQQREK